MKKSAAILLSSAMLLCLTACTNNGSGSDTTTSGTTVSATSTTEEMTTTPEETSSAEESTDATGEITAETVLAAIRDAYGENYYSNTAIPDEMLQDTFGIDDTMYDEVASEMPMIGVHADRIVVVKAKDGMVDQVEEKFNTARETMINAQTMYPMNIAKTNATQIVKNGNFIAFILAGAADEREDASDDEMATFANEQAQIGVDAFNSVFGTGGGDAS